MQFDHGQGLTRIQQRNRQIILEAALSVFAANGYRGATIDQISEQAGMSKPNILYYFTSKDDIHQTLLTGLLDVWLAPMQKIDPDGDPLNEVLGYVAEKLRMSRKYPRESRLFAFEVMQGAPNLSQYLGGPMRDLVAQTTKILQNWMQDGKLRQVDPNHLIFSIWAMTQHYADFETQIDAVLGVDPFPDAAVFLDNMYRRLLEV